MNRTTNLQERWWERVPYQNIILDTQERIAILTVNRPQALNALNRDTLLEIGRAVSDVAHDNQADILIITGSGEKAFVAGADIAYMQDLNAVEGRQFGLLGQQVFHSIETLEKPAIAAVNGFALGGGCELAMSCDFRIASAKAKFGQPEVGLGITPGFGGTQRLARLVGPAMAKQLLFTGEAIDAVEALRIGLVNRVVEPQQLLEVAQVTANKIRSNSPLAVRFCKSAVNEGLQTDIDRGMTIEADLFGICFSTLDQKEGMKAFLEKRPPQFAAK